MEYTKNLNLSKPSYDDDVDVQVLNNNMDILDDKVGNLPFLPLKGGTMSGDIKLPYNDPDRAGLHSTRSNEEYLAFAQTNFKGVPKATLATKSDRFKFYCPSGSEFVVDDSGPWYNGDKIPQIVSEGLAATHGYVKLSNGLILQWGYVTAASYDGNVQHVTFETPMKNQNYLVFISKSNYISGKPSFDSGEWYSSTYNYTSTGFDVICDSNDTSIYWFWFAIGTNA